MKTSTIKTSAERKAATEKRLESMRKNLAALETRADAILNKGDDMTSADRLALLSLVNVAYHESGKIETIYSVDGTSGCAFCEKMRNAAESNVLIICGGCYAYADKWKEAAWRRHTLNARILSTVSFTVDELKALDIPAGARLRINEDGDIVNGIHAANVLRIALAFPSVSVGFWYKNVPAVAEGLRALNIATREQRPANVRFIQSSVYIGIPAVAAWFTDVVFTVYPDAKTTLAAINSGAWECNGRKCKTCGYNCYNAGKNAAEGVQHVAEVLRCSAAMRAVIMAAYTAWIEKHNNR